MSTPELSWKHTYFFFFQAEDGIRDHCVTGVQTCALPISALLVVAALACRDDVLPDVLAAAVAGDRVVEGEVVAALAAVLAGVGVPEQDVLGRHPSDRAGLLVDAGRAERGTAGQSPFFELGE